jgi:acyl carrier protein
MLDSRVSAAIADVFGVPEADLTAQSNPDTVPDWDSVGHFKLILHLEEVFGVRFSASEIGSLMTAGRIEEALVRLKALP